MFIIKFVHNHIKIKSNWFDDNGKINKIGPDGLFLYIMLHKYLLINQEKTTFIISIDQLRRQTGFSLDKTYELFKSLVRNKIITCSVTRWDRYDDKELLFAFAEDEPMTIRESNSKGEETDVPVSADDYFISVDMQMMQYYLDLRYKGAEIALYCLIRKHSNNRESKCWMSIDKMSEILGLSNDKVSKMIRSMNREYLLCSRYKKNGKRIVGEEEMQSYRFEHSLAYSMSKHEAFRQSPDVIATIEQNIRKWDRQKMLKRSVKK